MPGASPTFTNFSFRNIAPLPFERQAVAQDTVNCDLFRGQNGYMSFIVDPKLVFLSCNEQLLKAVPKNVVLELLLHHKQPTPTFHQFFHLQQTELVKTETEDIQHDLLGDETLG